MGRPKETTRLGRELRLRRGDRSLREIARLSRKPPCTGRVAGISATSLHQIERGARLPSVDQVRTLSLLYGLPIQRFYDLMEPAGDPRDPRSVPDPEEFGELRRQAGRWKDRDPSRYLACLARCEEAAPEISALVWVRKARARALRSRGQHADAAGLLLDLLRVPDLPTEEFAGIWLEIAETLARQGNLEVAEAAARRGLGRCGETEEDRPRWAHLTALLGRILRRRAEADGAIRRAREAVGCLERARDAFQELEMAAEALVAEVELGRAHLAEGSPVLGIETLRRAARRAASVPSRRPAAEAQLALGETLLSQDRPAEARERLVRAERLAAELGRRDLRFRALVALARAVDAVGGRSEGLRKQARALLPWVPAGSGMERRRLLEWLHRRSPDTQPLPGEGRLPGEESLEDRSGPLAAELGAGA